MKGFAGFVAFLIAAGVGFTAHRVVFCDGDLSIPFLTQAATTGPDRPPTDVISDATQELTRLVECNAGELAGDQAAGLLKEIDEAFAQLPGIGKLSLGMLNGRPLPPATSRRRSRMSSS